MAEAPPPVDEQAPPQVDAVEQLRVQEEASSLYPQPPESDDGGGGEKKRQYLVVMRHGQRADEVCLIVSYVVKIFGPALFSVTYVVLTSLIFPTLTVLVTQIDPDWVTTAVRPFDPPLTEKGEEQVRGAKQLLNLLCGFIHGLSSYPQNCL